MLWVLQRTVSIATVTPQRISMRIWKFKFCAIIAQTDAIGQEIFDTLWMLAKCFTIIENLFCKWYKCLRMLANAVANFANVLCMKQEHKTWVTNLHNTHCVCFSLSYICETLSSLFSLKFVLISAFFGNVNTNSSKSLQTLLRTPQECLHTPTNFLWSLQICVKLHL